MIRPSRSEPIHVTVAANPDDPRLADDPPGVIVHRTPPLHPDDVAIVDGIPCTSVARTLVDLADVMERDELRATFATARARGMLDIPAVEASFVRVEWRPSRALLREVIDEFSC